MRRVFSLLALLILIVLFSAAPAAAQSGKPWRHGIIELKNDAGIIMMVTKGFAEKQGVKLEIVQFKNDLIALQALLADEIDSFEGGPAGPMIAASRGTDPRILGCQWPGVPYGVFVRPDIAAPADLKGKIFAISAPGANPDVVARVLLAKYGIPAAAVRFVSLGADADRFKAVVAGVADATVVSNEYTPIAARQGVKLLVPAREIVPDFVRLCIISRQKTLAVRADDAARFLAAEMTAMRYVLAHRDETLKLTSELVGVKPDDPRPAFFFDDAVKSHSIDPTLAVPMAKLAWIENQLLADGNLAKPIDLSTLVAPEIRAAALARAGP